MSSHGIDPATFSALCDSTGADFVQELVDTFAEEAPGLVEEMRAARATGAADDFRRAAHAIKSNALTFGAMELATMARDLEHQGLAAEAAATDSLDAALKAAIEALRNLCRG